MSTGGILQPFSDAVKLFLKEITYPYKSSYFLFLLAPVLGLFIVLCTWWVYPNAFGHVRFRYSRSLFLVFLAINIYPLFLAGWSSSRKYAVVGATRGIAQSVSYEIRLALLLLRFLRLGHTLGLSGLLFERQIKSLIYIIMPVVLFWFVCCVAETNRSPFDFAEGESELVSGFNIEYGSAGFALVFMAEYARILFLSYVTGLLVVPANYLLRTLLMIVLGRVWVWLRCTYPRYRYDKLMGLAWKRILPSALIFCFFFLPLSSV